MNTEENEGYPGIAHDFLQCQNQRNELLVVLRKIARGEFEIRPGATFVGLQKMAQDAIDKAEGK